jgi:hypothetical protein
LIEGYPSQDVEKGTVTRYIYIVDVAYGSNRNGVELYVYKKVDTITSDTDSVTVTLFKTVSLPLSGGTGTIAFMAASFRFLYIGTNHNNQPVQVQKSNLALSPLSAISSDSTNISAITADQYGYVTVTAGGVFETFNPKGQVEEEGGGANFMLNNVKYDSSSRTIYAPVNSKLKLSSSQPPVLLP